METRPDIEAIRKRVEAATCGPWCAIIPPDDKDPADFPYDGYGELRTMATDERDGFDLILKVDDFDKQDANLEFCAHAITDIPDLLAYIADLEQRLEPHQ
jgi:hypothetical protein